MRFTNLKAVYLETFLACTSAIKKLWVTISWFFNNFFTISESKSQLCLIVYFAGSELEAYSDEDYSGEGRRGRHGGAWDRRNKR